LTVVVGGGGGIIAERIMSDPVVWTVTEPSLFMIFTADVIPLTFGTPPEPPPEPDNSKIGVLPAKVTFGLWNDLESKSTPTEGGLCNPGMLILMLYKIYEKH
jgi:hypothetical protein